jgi:hypothetical protein
MRTCTLTCAIIVACAPRIAEGAGHASGRRLHEERPQKARILAGVAQPRVPARVLAPEAGVGDELDRFAGQAADSRDHLVRELAFARVHDEGALIARLDDDVGAIADQHVDVVAEGQHMDLTVARLAVQGSARFGGPARRGGEKRLSLGFGGRRHARVELGIHRHGAQQPGGQRDLVTGRELADERLLAEQVVRHEVVGAVEDLLAVVACVQPRARIHRLPGEVAAAHHRLGEIHGV